MPDFWSDEIRDDFVSKIKATNEKIKVPPFRSILGELEEYEVEVPEDYDDALDLAIEILAKIQKYRDILISIRIAMVDKRNLLNKLWHTARASFLVKDEVINEMKTVIKREASIKMTFSKLFAKKELADEHVTCLFDLTENAVAKFNTCSRQIALIEMQIRLGEVESRRKRATKR